MTQTTAAASEGQRIAFDKYTLTMHKQGFMTATINEEEWPARDLVGDKLVLAMFERIVAIESELDEAQRNADDATASLHSHIDQLSASRLALAGVVEQCAKVCEDLIEKDAPPYSSQRDYNIAYENAAAAIRSAIDSAQKGT